MTHDELLAKIDDLNLYDSGYNLISDALRAVVELHKQIYDNSCHHCATWYPCPTIRVIEKELK